MPFSKKSPFSVLSAAALTALFAGNPAHSAPAPAALSFEDAYQAALQKTETLQIQQTSQEQARERLSQARGSLLPTVNAVGTYLRQDGSSFSSGNSAITNFLEEQKTARISLSQPVFRGLREFAGLRLAKDQLKAQESQTQEVALTLYQSVGQSFYAVLSAQKDLLNVNKLFELTEKRLGELKERAKIGRSRRGEVLSADSQLAATSAQRTAAEAQLKQAWDSFTLATGVAAANDPQQEALRDDLRLPQRISGLDFYLERAKSRPGLEAQRAALEASDEGVSIAKGAHWPSVDLFGNYYLKRPGLLDEVKWDASVTLTIPIFQGGAIQSQVREAAIVRQGRELALNQFQRTVERDVKVAFESLRSLLEQIEALKKSAELSELNYREQQKDYRYGLVTNLEVLQALNAFIDNQRALDRARYSAKVAYINLQAASGSRTK